MVTPRVQEVARRWEIIVGGESHVVELEPQRRASFLPGTFSLDRQPLKLPGHFFAARRQRDFAIGPHRGVLRGEKVGFTFRQALWRQISPIKGNLPAIIAAGILGGEAGAASATSTATAFGDSYGWVVYDLLIDDQSMGRWVASIRNAVVASWTFSPAGEGLPDMDWPDWPRPRGSVD
jgi:hypothetical protein